MMSAEERLIEVGKITSAFGIKGWLKIYSYTDPQQQISRYSPWLIGDELKSYNVSASQLHNRGVIAKLEDVDDRNAAETFCGQKIAVPLDKLEEADDSDGYYWFQLVGMRVVNQDNNDLGVVERLFATGANDIMTVVGEKGKRLIPYVTDKYVKNVDLDRRVITVDWQTDW